MDIQSTPGKGTSVAVELPAPEGASVRRVPANPPAEYGASAREVTNGIAAYAGTEPVSGRSGSSILLVEDDPDMLASLSRLLRPHFQVTTAENGEDGLRRLAEMKPMLIVSDVMMPGMDGFAFIREVRSREETAAVPVIFLTALHSHEEVLEGLQYGAVDYIRKPFDRDVFLEKIRSLLSAQSRIISDYNRRFREYLEKWDPRAGQAARMPVQSAASCRCFPTYPEAERSIGAGRKRVHEQRDSGIARSFKEDGRQSRQHNLKKNGGNPAHPAPFRNAAGGIGPAVSPARAGL